MAQFEIKSFRVLSADHLKELCKECHSGLHFIGSRNIDTFVTISIILLVHYFERVELHEFWLPHDKIGLYSHVMLLLERCGGSVWRQKASVSAFEGDKLSKNSRFLHFFLHV